MSTRNTTSLILNKIKEYYNFKTDKELADYLGIAPTTLSSWYARNRIDYLLVYTRCKEIDGNFLLTGEGKMLRQPGSDGSGDDAVKRAEQLAAENEELRTQLELQKKLLEAKDETIEALQRAVRLLEKQEKVTETRTEVVEGVVGRKA